MQFEIHALGDASWVYFVINAVSSITGYGTLGALGAMLGLLGMAFSGITSKSGPQLDVAWIMLSFVMFYAFFIPRADRVIIAEVNPPSHLVQPRTYVVDNVPMGLAVVGTVVTKIGLSLAQEYDTTFGSVTDTERVLTGAVGANIRRIADLRMMQDLSFTDSSGTFALNRKNMAYYMAGCTVPGIAMGHMTYEKVMAGTSETGTDVEGLLSRIKYAHPARRTEFFKADGSMEILDCSQAYDRLVAAMTGPDGFGKGLAQALHERGRGASPDQAYDSMAQTFQKFGYDAQDLQTFAMANVMHSVYLTAVMGDSSNRHNQAMTMMVEQAMAQRNAQFAGEESMFVALLRPSVSFFEALFYGLAPIIAFLIPLGPMGLKLVGKYMMFTIWVVLYFPLLAIIGAFGDTQFYGAMEALKDVALTPHGSMMVLKEAQNTLGTVSLLAAAVPQLALAILMGGPVAMSALAGRMQGGDMIDEKLASPSAGQIGAGVSAAPMFTGTSGGGVVQNGAPLQTYSLQDALTQNVSSSKTEQAQAAESFSSSVSSTIASLKSAQNSSQYATDANYRQTVDDALERGLQLQDSLKREQSDKADRTAGTQSATGGSLGAGGGPGGVTVGGTQNNTNTQGGGVGQGTVLKYDQGGTDSASQTRGLAEAFATGVSAVSTMSGGSAVSVQDADQLQQSMSDVYSKTEAYSESTAAAQGITSSLTFTDAQIADRVSDGAQVLGFRSGDDALASVYNGLPASAQSYFQQTKAELESRNDFVGDASAAALWRTVTDGRSHVPMEDRDELARGANTMAQLIAGQSAGIPTGDASAAKGVAGDVGAGAAWAAVNENGGLPGSQVSRGEVDGMVRAAEGGAATVIDRAGGAVEQRQAEISSENGMLTQTTQQRDAFMDRGGSLVADHREDAFDKAREAIENRSPGAAAVSDFVSVAQGTVQDVGRKVADRFDDRDNIARTEGEIAVAEEAFQAKLTEVERLYPDKGWSQEEKEAVATYETWKSGNQVTAEREAGWREHNTPALESEYLRSDQDVTVMLRKEADAIDIQGLPSEMLERRNAD